MQFNAVVETNVAAVRLWQVLGFQIIGTVPEAFAHRELVAVAGPPTDPAYYFKRRKQTESSR